jgi:hypothetical protein
LLRAVKELAMDEVLEFGVALGVELGVGFEFEP